MTSYRMLLQDEFQQRVRRNPAYTLRAYARDLGVPVSNLSDVLRSKRGLAIETARKMAESLRLGEHEGKYFVALVQKEHGRSLAQRSEAEGTLRALEAAHGMSEISLETFAVLADWVHFAVLELTYLEDFRADGGWIAARLGISRAEADAAVEKALKLGLLARDADGRLRDAEKNLATGNDVPSKYIRDHHRQILAKAERALEEVGVEEREFAAITMAIDASKLPEAKAALREFRRKFCKNIQHSRKKNRVYCVALQFFPMDRAAQGKGIEA